MGCVTVTKRAGSLCKRIHTHKHTPVRQLERARMQDTGARVLSGEQLKASVAENVKLLSGVIHFCSVVSKFDLAMAVPGGGFTRTCIASAHTQSCQCQGLLYLHEAEIMASVAGPLLGAGPPLAGCQAPAAARHALSTDHENTADAFLETSTLVSTLPYHLLDFLTVPLSPCLSFSLSLSRSLKV